MLMFLVEAFVGRTDTSALSATVDRLAAATHGAPARLRSAYHLPADETCFYVMEAADARTLTRLLHAAGVDATRITEVLDQPTHRTAPTGTTPRLEDR